MISPDAPITSSKDDRLGRGPFAEAVAKAVEAFDGSESFVIGVHGPWGTGKSSVLNLIEEAIEERNRTVPEEKRIHILRFNPWNFADHSYLVLQFLKQLSVHLRKFEKWHKRKLKGVIDLVDEYADALAPPVEAVRFGRPIVGMGRLSLAWGRKQLGAAKDPDQLFRSVSGLLAEQKRKTVVIIDDIDRLSAPEVRQIFQLVKTTARFPYVVYILAFDKEAVARALQDEGTRSGVEYLEKIVQMGFDLPPVSGQTLTSFLTTGLDEILKKYPAAHFDKHRFGNIFHSGFRQCFSSLRHIRRYLNGLEFGFGMISKELNGVDFFGLEALRTFYPDIYDVVRSNKSVFAGHIDYNISQAGPQAFKAQVDTLLTKKGERSAPEDLLVSLFPKLEYANGGMNYGAGSEEQWEKEYRIGTERYFDAYFQLVLPSDEVAVAEVNEAIRATSDTSMLENTLRKFLTSGRIKNAISSIRSRLDEVPIHHLGNTCQALVNIGDSVEHDGSLLGGDIPEYWEVRWAISETLERMKPGERVDVFKRILVTTGSIATTADLIVYLAELREKRPDKFADLTKEALDGMRADFVAKVRLSAEQGSLLRSPELYFTLARWGKWADENEPKTFAQKIIGDRKALPTFLASFISENHSASLRDKVVRVTKKVGLQSLAKFLDLKSLGKTLEDFSDEGLNEEEAAVVLLVKNGLRRLQNEGLTPEQFDNSPWN